MIEGMTPNTNPVGRPRVRIPAEQVRELRDRGASWREIAKTLRIGTATAMRLFGSTDGARPNIQAVGPKASEHAQPFLGSVEQSRIATE
jgi:DNA invertase Pin-like site-specific DNA recombinase